MAHPLSGQCQMYSKMDASTVVQQKQVEQSHYWYNWINDLEDCDVRILQSMVLIFMFNKYSNVCWVTVSSRVV